MKSKHDDAHNTKLDGVATDFTITLDVQNRDRFGCCLLKFRFSTDQNNQDRRNYYNHGRELKRTRRSGTATYSSYTKLILRRSQPELSYSEHPV